MPGIVIVRTGGEIGIKSKPVRSGYERLILRSIKTRMKASSLAYTKIWRIAGRIYIECEEAATVAKALSRLFGVSSTSPGISMAANLETIVSSSARLAKRGFVPGTFAVRCRRVGEHGYSSQDVCRAVGKAVLSVGVPLKVDLDEPDQVMEIEIRDGMAVIFFGDERGPDGFPLGAQGPVVGIVDGSPESLLACWSIMKRGSDLRAVSPASSGSAPTLDRPTERHLRLLAAWEPGGAIRASVFSLPGGLNPAEKELFLISAAASVAQRRGVEAVVSGLSPSPGSMRHLKAFPVYPLFPLAAMDQDLASLWASALGLEERGPFGKGIDFSGIFPSEKTQAPEKPCAELTVKV